jgi:hypothetical protein
MAVDTPKPTLQNGFNNQNGDSEPVANGHSHWDGVQAIPPAGATAPPMSLEAQVLDNRDPKVHLADIDVRRLLITSKWL